MSSRNYTVTVKVKDGGILKQLENLQNGSPLGGKGGGSKATGGGAFKALEGTGLKQLTKLAGIGLSVGALVALTVKSSGILQGTMKLWETSIMLIFKPIGDFVGFALRPLALLILSWAIPFYKVAGPWFRDYGRTVGEALLKLGSPEGFREHIIERTNTTTRDITLGGFGLNQAGAVILSKIISELSSINMGLTGVGQYLFSVFIGVGQAITSTLAGLPNYFFGVLGAVGSNINDALMSVPGFILSVFTGLATNLANTLAGIPGMIWDAIVKAVTGFGSGTGGGVDNSSRMRGLSPKNRIESQTMAETVS